MIEPGTKVHTERVTLVINGLDRGGGGSLTAERALARVTGVVWAYVNPATEMAYVEYDPVMVLLAHLIAAVERTGLRVGEMEMR